MQANDRNTATEPLPRHPDVDIVIAYLRRLADSGHRYIDPTEAANEIEDGVPWRS